MARAATLRIYPAHFVTAPGAIERGHGGSTHRSWYLRAVVSGATEYVWHTHNDGSTGGGVATGDDPGAYVSELSGGTGLPVALAAGLVTASTRATAIAAALALRPWCTSATVAGANNPDGSRNITVVGQFSAIAVGARTNAQRGAAGVHGSHQFRRAVGGDGTLTRNIAQRISHPPATARVHAVSIVLGATVSTTAANIPRLYLRTGGTSDSDPAGSTVLFDFGQLPVSEVVAGRRARINLTSAQVATLRAALTAAAASRLWLCVKAAATTTLSRLATATSRNGEFFDESNRVDVVTSGDGSTAAPAAWNSTGMFSGNVVIGCALHYEVDPAGNGEAYPPIGSLETLTDTGVFPNSVALPDSETSQVCPTEGHEGAHLHSLESVVNAGQVRNEFFAGGDISNLDAPNMTGATLLHGLGLTSGTGIITQLCPTGDASIAVPAVLSLKWKGFTSGAIGQGNVNPAATMSVVQPNDFARRSGADATTGDGTLELDYAAPGGDETTPCESPVSSASSAPDNIPARRITVRRSADVVTMLASGGASSLVGVICDLDG